MNKWIETETNCQMKWIGRQIDMQINRQISVDKYEIDKLKDKLIGTWMDGWMDG